MRADPTLVDRDKEVANGKDLTSPAISVARLTVCRSSLHRDVPYCAVSVSLRVVQLSPEPELLFSYSLDQELQKSSALGRALSEHKCACFTSYDLRNNST
jgi:hypothetical protein